MDAATVGSVATCFQERISQGRRGNKRLRQLTCKGIRARATSSTAWHVHKPRRSFCYPVGACLLLGSGLPRLCADGRRAASPPVVLESGSVAPPRLYADGRLASFDKIICSRRLFRVGVRPLLSRSPTSAHWSTKTSWTTSRTASAQAARRRGGRTAARPCGHPHSACQSARSVAVHPRRPPACPQDACDSS